MFGWSIEWNNLYLYMFVIFINMYNVNKSFFPLNAPIYMFVDALNATMYGYLYGYYCSIEHYLHHLCHINLHTLFCHTECNN